MIGLDLFSGIGGFALAASWVWGPEYEIVSFCEIDPFCRKVLKKHWPDVPIHNDIKTMKGDSFGTIDILTGGFPCQPYSCAGKRRGKEDDRALWPEMLRVIKEAKPRWIIGENVSGFINMGLDDCISDLEGEGYETTAFIIPACSVNAPHRRDRIWIIGNSKSAGKADEREIFAGRNGNKESAYSRSVRPEKQKQQTAGSQRCDCDAADSSESRLQNEFCGKFRSIQSQIKPSERCKSCRTIPKVKRWAEPWLEAAQRLCKLDDGLPTGLDGRGLIRNKYRTQKLKALGNAICPSVVVPIMQAIKEIELEK